MKKIVCLFFFLIEAQHNLAYAEGSAVPTDPGSIPTDHSMDKAVPTDHSMTKEEKQDNKTSVKTIKEIQEKLPKYHPCKLSNPFRKTAFADNYCPKRWCITTAP